MSYVGEITNTFKLRVEDEKDVMFILGCFDKSSLMFNMEYIKEDETNFSRSGYFGYT